MTFETVVFIVCILVINGFIFAGMRSPRICAIIFGALLAVPYFLLGYVYDGLSQYPQRPLVCRIIYFLPFFYGCIVPKNVGIYCSKRF
jgi:hypothetical protein